MVLAVVISTLRLVILGVFEVGQILTVGISDRDVHRSREPRVPW